MTAPHDFDKRFTEALAAAPDVPDCFDEIIHRIKRKNTVLWAMRSVAAVLLISLGSFLVVSHTVREPVAPEVVEELQSIYNHVSGKEIGQDFVSCSLIGEDSY
jgi:hypothetical protein